MSRFISYENEVDMGLALMAVAACPNLDEAVEYLKVEHNITTTASKIESIARKKPAELEELRAKLTPIREQMLTHNLMDNALYASEVVRVAMEQLVDRLAKNQIRPEYLSRVARDVADVQAKSIEKKLTLEGRPATIVENRSPEQIIAALERKGILRPVKQIEIEQGDPVGS